MARHKVIHHEDATTINIKGDKRNPEPSSAIITFPGGSVEVSRTSDGSYWVHTQVLDEPDHATESPQGKILDSRVDYSYPYGNKNGIPNVPDHEHINHIAIRVATA